MAAEYVFRFSAILGRFTGVLGIMGPYPINSFVTGDALEFLRNLPNASVPMFLFSPPYNLGVSSDGGFKGIGRRGGNHKWDGGKLADGYATYNDAMLPEKYIDWQKEILTECWRSLADNGAIYYNHKPRVQGGELQTPLVFNPGLPVRQIVIWARAGGVNFTTTAYCPTHEWIVIYAKSNFRLKSQGASGAGDVWSIPQESNTWHPAPFPLALAERAIETVMPAFVVDPFAGSGTTAVAAKKLGVDYLCNELSPEYVAYAQKRLSKVFYMPRMEFTQAVQMAMEVQG